MMYIVDIHLLWKISDSVNIRGHVFFTSYHCTAQDWHQLDNAHLALAWRSSNSSEFGLPRDAWASERSGSIPWPHMPHLYLIEASIHIILMFFSSHEGLRSIVKQHIFMFAKLSLFLRSCRRFRPLSRMLIRLITRLHLGKLRLPVPWEKSRVIFSHFLMSLFSPQHSLKEHLHNSHCVVIHDKTWKIKGLEGLLPHSISRQVYP